MDPPEPKGRCHFAHGRSGEWVGALLVEIITEITVHSHTAVKTEKCRPPLALWSRCGSRTPRRGHRAGSRRCEPLRCRPAHLAQQPREVRAASSTAARQGRGHLALSDTALASSSENLLPPPLPRERPSLAGPGVTLNMRFSLQAFSLIFLLLDPTVSRSKPVEVAGSNRRLGPTWVGLRSWPAASSLGGSLCVRGARVPGGVDLQRLGCLGTGTEAWGPRDEYPAVA